MHKPSNSRLGSFSSRVSSSLAPFLIFARVYFTRHTSLLFLKPYSPIQQTAQGLDTKTKLKPQEIFIFARDAVFTI